VIVFDFAGYSNKAQTTINLVKTVEQQAPQDTQAPTLLEDQISVEKQDDGKFKVTLKFEDNVSVAGGKVVNNGNILKEFE